MEAIPLCNTIKILFLLICFYNVIASDDDDLEFSSGKNTYDFFKAEKACKDKGKRLVAIETKEKNDKIYKKLKEKGDRSSYWTAAKRSTDPPDPYIANLHINLPFRWPCGSRLIYRNFVEDRPNNVGKYDQARMFISIQNNGSGLYWTDRTYRRKFKYICEAKKITDVPENWDGFVLTGYQYSGFENILNHCFQMTGSRKKPIKLDTQEKSDALRDVLRSNDNRIQYFLPAKRKDINSPFEWINGTTVTNANWDDNQPTTNEKDLCVLFNYNPAKNQVVWSSAPCEGTRRVACEKN